MKPENVIITTEHDIPNHEVIEVLEIINSDVVVGVNFVRDFFARVRDFIGGRSRSYENAFKSSREKAYSALKKEASEKGGNAVIGVDSQFAVMGKDNSMFAVLVTGTLVKIEPTGPDSR